MSYYDEESTNSLREETRNLPYERQGLWQQVVEYAEHVSGPRTRGAVVCKIGFVALLLLSMMALLFTAVRG